VALDKRGVKEKKTTLKEEEVTKKRLYSKPSLKQEALAYVKRSSKDEGIALKISVRNMK
jgi:hypothetical protein